MENQKISWFDRQAINYERSRFGAMSAMLTIQSCLGSVAALYILKVGQPIMLAICIALTMGSNAAFISQLPAKWCVGMFLASVSINSLFILYNLLS